MSVEEYLEFERDSEVRHEFVGGVAYAMTGATRRHNRIAGNIYRRLADKAENGPCRVYVEGVKVRIRDDAGYYPDVMVVCADEPDDEYTETEPCLIVEVASPSTERIDRHEKLGFYKTIPTLNAYLVVEQERRVVERYLRDGNGEWSRSVYDGEDSFDVPCPPGMRLSVGGIYAGL